MVHKKIYINIRRYTYNLINSKAIYFGFGNRV
nr:MAG TPA: Sulfolobus virus coat protein C terminal [Caudoviricetes sp.]